MTINLPDFHSTLGAPAKIYPYRDNQGNVYAAVYRFKESTGKTIRPFDALKGSWTFPSNPPPYNVEGIKTGPIIIVEGEKCADALGAFGISGITSMGGSNQAGKTDWSSLKNRDVIIWPDNDEAGLKYANVLKVILLKEGVRSLRICSLKKEVLLKITSLRKTVLKEENSPLLKEQYNLMTSIDNLPKGWDVADAVSEGWEAEHIKDFLKEAIPVDNLKDNSSIETPANDNWPEPDLSILETDTPPPKFPIGIFSPPIADWLLKTAEGKSAPVDYVAGTLLSSSASLIGNTRKVSPWEGWSEPCILWIALVGDPSSGKSPAMDPVLDKVKKLEAEEVPAFEDAQLIYETGKLEAEISKTNWQKDVKTAQEQNLGIPIMPKSAVEPDAPMRPRLIIRDATSEALCLAMQSQPKGLLMHRDELAGWFGSFDRYSGGKGGDRPFWLECFGGKTFTQDRIKNGAKPITIPNLSASIVGSIQPDRLQSCLMTGDDDGLSSRFLYIYPTNVERRRPRHLADDKLIERAFKKLHALQMDKGEDHTPLQRVISLSIDASDTFEAWWTDQGKDTPSGKSSGWHGKLAGIALRLSLIMTYLEWATSYDQPEPYEISADTISKAIKLITDYLTPMAERAFGIAAKTDIDQNTLALANWIIDNKPDRIIVRDLTRGKGPFPSNTKAEVIKAACMKLVGLGWLRADFVRKGENAGRGQQVFLVNPCL